MGLSKSRYTLFCQCPKALWLRTYKHEVATPDPSLEARFIIGNEVGDLAMELFGEYVDVTFHKEDGSLDLNKMIELTKQHMEQGTENICEASFAHEDNYCAVDILRRTHDGWAIYEVKSSTSSKDEELTAPDKFVKYAVDIAYQRWLLEQCGVKVTGTYLVTLNRDYVLNGKLDIQHLFNILDLKDLVDKEYSKVPSLVPLALKVLQQDEPNEPVALHCHVPYDCAFFGYCTKGIVTPNVFDLYRMNFATKCELYNKGKISFEDLAGERLTPIQQIQVNTCLNKTQLVTPDEIEAFLKKLPYPLYFLDFETMMMAVPKYDGTKPYQQIPFQYSLHWIEKEGGDLQHSEFLGNALDDPRRALAEKLCREIPMEACTLAYNKVFECKRLEELAKAFPDLSAHLLDISKNIVDLIEPFRKKMVYLPEMNGSFSIKHVLPALYPDDPELDYSNLSGNVHNGGDAMTSYPKLAKMTDPKEVNQLRQSLLEYCRLDTLAMVRVWEKLWKLAKKKP